ncbi:MAG: glycosyltransferase family 2 protein [Granulosicoccus sp.]|nr:glycosyltransferase family 2 protein [Granulosicoccus sp.]
MNVVLCICTYRRPEGLETLLNALPELQHDVQLSIVVSDNDKARQGIAVVESLPKSYPYPIYAISELNAGISAARNSAVNKALSLQPELVAFLDDDEWPQAQWLNELLRIQAEQQADAVGGPTKPVFPDETPESVIDNDYYGADLNLADGSLCQLQAGGNFLIRASVLEAYKPDFFHPSFAYSGGEDLAFFTQLAKDGYRMAWASNAIVYEPVPPARLADGWLKRRIINIHNSRVRVMQMLDPGLGPTIMRGIKTIALGGAALLLTTASIVMPRYRQAAQMMRWKFRGKLTAHFGRATVRGETY